MDTKFRLNSDECELLLAFEKAKSLEKLAGIVNRDISAVSRRLQHLSSKAPVIEKVGNRWRLTQMGAQVNRWTEEASSQQAKTLSQRTEISEESASSRGFCNRVVKRTGALTWLRMGKTPA